jgi:hypothetical protein
LNQEAYWKERSQIKDWLGTICNRKLSLAESDIDGFEEALAFMRECLETMHFGEQPDLTWLDRQLAQVRLTVLPDKSDVHELLPLLHVRKRDDSDSELIHCLTKTLLLQFAQFLSQPAKSVMRCEGLYREPGCSTISVLRSVSDSRERRWRAEIPQIADHDLIESPNVHRCPDIFVAAPKSRFCSDTCRFTTFQIAKQLKSPRYHAEKQKRYRDTLKPKSDS